MRFTARSALIAALSLGAGGCMVGPDYERPTAPTPAAYKEAPGWKVAQPADDAPRGNWWEAYRDPELDALVAQVDISNQTVKAAEARDARSLGRNAGRSRGDVAGGQRQRRGTAQQPRHRVQHQCQHAIRREQQLQRGARGELGGRPVGRHPAQHRGQRDIGAGQHRRPGQRTALRAGAAGPGLPGAARRRMRRFHCCRRRSRATSGRCSSRATSMRRGSSHAATFRRPKPN